MAISLLYQKSSVDILSTFFYWYWSSGETSAYMGHVFYAITVCPLNKCPIQLALTLDKHSTAHFHQLFMYQNLKTGINSNVGGTRLGLNIHFSRFDKFFAFQLTTMFRMYFVLFHRLKYRLICKTVLWHNSTHGMFDVFGSSRLTFLRFISLSRRKSPDASFPTKIPSSTVAWISASAFLVTLMSGLPFCYTTAGMRLSWGMANLSNGYIAVFLKADWRFSLDNDLIYGLYMQAGRHCT